MNKERLRFILQDTTVSLGQASSKTSSREVEDVDCGLAIVRVFRMVSEKHRDEIVAILNMYPEREMFLRGVSYRDLVEMIGDGEMALRLFALGQALELWEISTPEKLGVKNLSKEEERDLLQISPIRAQAPRAFSRVR